MVYWSEVLLVHLKLTAAKINLLESLYYVSEWFGLLFIRRGVYAGTVLRFTLHLPADFPSKTLPVS